MKKLLLTLVLGLICMVCASAQNTNKYVVALKNGINVECVSYKLTSDNNIEVTYIDGTTVNIKMDDVDKISPIGAKQETKAQTQEPYVQSAQPSRTANQQVAASSNVYNAAPVYAGPRKDPFLAGLLSFFIPGVGQFYNGQVGAGVGFLLGSIVLSALTFGENIIYLVPLAGLIVVDVWAIVHAAKGAKRINAQRGYALGNGKYLNAQPTLLNSCTLSSRSNSYHYGMTLSLTF